MGPPLRPRGVDRSEEEAMTVRAELPRESMWRELSGRFVRKAVASSLLVGCYQIGYCASTDSSIETQIDNGGRSS